MKPKVALKLAGILAVMAVSASAVASPATLGTEVFPSFANEGFVLASGKEVGVARGLQALGNTDPILDILLADAGKEQILGVHSKTPGEIGVGMVEAGGWNPVAAVSGVGDYVEGWLSAGRATVAQERPMVHLPIPAVGWLFGSALIGFVSLSNRRKV